MVAADHNLQRNLFQRRALQPFQKVLHLAAGATVGHVAGMNENVGLRAKLGQLRFIIPIDFFRRFLLLYWELYAKNPYKNHSKCKVSVKFLHTEGKDWQWTKISYKHTGGNE